MLSRTKRCSSLEESLADEIFHIRASRWRPLAESLRALEHEERPKRRGTAVAERKAPRRSYWGPWLWIK